MEDKLEILSDKISPNSNSQPNIEKLESELSILINDLTKIKEEGNDLYKKNQKEEALKVFLKGYKLFHDKSKTIYNDYFFCSRFNELSTLIKKILSNIALCYYKQENYRQAIIYDLEIIALEPTYGRSIVRLLKSYSKINKIQQSVYYGDIFMDLDKDTRNKFKDMPQIIEQEKIKLKNIQEAEKNNANKDLILFFGSFLTIFMGVLIFYLLKKQ
jgi:tetratricopeptide (TPR) repeat protein